MKKMNKDKNGMFPEIKKECFNAFQKKNSFTGKNQTYGANVSILFVKTVDIAPEVAAAVTLKEE